MWEVTWQVDNKPAEILYRENPTGEIISKLKQKYDFGRRGIVLSWQSTWQSFDVGKNN